jgi:TDG/mug DNA glycosylase family protein
MAAMAIQVAGRPRIRERRGLRGASALAWLEKLPRQCPTWAHFALDFGTMKRLRDIVAPQLRVLFVGINPGLRSAEIGHHFGGKTNPFWRLLHAAGFTPELLPPEEDARLTEWGLGITNLCARPSRAADELTREELQAGAKILARKVARLRPRAVALVGISLYKQVFPAGKTPGPGEKPDKLAGAPVFVLPNPSGLNASFPGFAQKLVWFEKLRQWLR